MDHILPTTSTSVKGRKLYVNYLNLSVGYQVELLGAGDKPILKGENTHFDLGMIPAAQMVAPGADPAEPVVPTADEIARKELRDKIELAFAEYFAGVAA